MKLLIVTPVRVVIETDDVEFVRGEDETGAFGIRPGHADFLSRLTVSVLSWRDKNRRDHFVALRGGVLSVTDGTLVEVAAADAEASDDLDDLRQRLVETFRKRDLEDEEERAKANRLHSAAIRQIQRVLRAARETTSSNSVPRLQVSNPSEGRGS